MSDNRNLQKAKNDKNDEFYTQAKDIAEEITHYDLKDKIVYCPCDTIRSSFFSVLDKIDLKALICTGLGLGIAKVKNNYLPIKPVDCFSEEALAAYSLADIVITNPPFSRFREFLSLLLKLKKDFLILGSQNALSYNDTFSLIKEEKISTGVNAGSFKFETPTGIKTLGNICWYTNLPVKGKAPISLSRDYNAFRTYDNYPAVEIPKISQIPVNLVGQAGVPITILTKQHDLRIVGKSDQLAGPVVISGKIKERPGRFYLNGKRLYERVVVEKSPPIPIKLQISGRDLEAAKDITTFSDNLRDRSSWLRQDCAIRGKLGEIAIRHLFEGADISVPEYSGGIDIDLMIGNNTAEIKTSLRPASDPDLETVISKRDIKIYSDYDIRDIYFQIYYDLDISWVEENKPEPEIYLDCCYFVGYKTKEQILQELEEFRRRGLPTTWSFGQKIFLRSPLKTCKSVMSFLESE